MLNALLRRFGPRFRPRPAPCLFMSVHLSGVPELSPSRWQICWRQPGSLRLAVGMQAEAHDNPITGGHVEGLLLHRSSKEPAMRVWDGSTFPPQALVGWGTKAILRTFPHQNSTFRLASSPGNSKSVTCGEMTFHKPRQLSWNVHAASHHWQGWGVWNTGVAPVAPGLNSGGLSRTWFSV